MNNDLRINHLAIFICFLILTGLGFLWYGPLLGEPWMKMIGLDPATVDANPPGASIWISNIIATLIPLYTLAWLFAKMGIISGLKGAGIGLLIGFSFIHISRMSSDMFALAPYALSWIVGGFHMVALTISGFILGAWTKTKESAS